MRSQGTPIRRLIAALTALSLLLSACGSGDDESTETTSTEAADEAAATTAPPATDPPATEAPAPETTIAAATTTEAAAAPEATDTAAGGAATITLAEFTIEASPVVAGTTSFAVDNAGDFPHEFAITRGTSYEELPLLSNGSVDEDALGDDFLGRTDLLQGGQSATIEFDLEPGDYVFFCNISVGPNSHAAAGQVLSVSIG